MIRAAPSSGEYYGSYPALATRDSVLLVCVDWDIAVLCLFLIATVAGFLWRRTRNRLLYWAWLGIVQIEVWARKQRDKKEGPRSL
jgi:hypothetical protein